MAYFNELSIATSLLWVFMAVSARIPDGTPDSALSTFYDVSGTMGMFFPEEMKKQIGITPLTDEAERTVSQTPIPAQHTEKIAIGGPHDSDDTITATETNPPDELLKDGLWQVGSRDANSGPIPAVYPLSHSWTSFKLRVTENGESKAQPPLSRTTKPSSPPIPAAEPPCTWTALRPFKLWGENKSVQSNTDETLLKFIIKLLIALPFLITAVIGIIYPIFTHRQIPNNIKVGLGPMELDMC